MIERKMEYTCDAPGCGRRIDELKHAWGIRQDDRYFTTRRLGDELVLPGMLHQLACSCECSSKLHSLWMNKMMGVKAA